MWKLILFAVVWTAVGTAVACATVETAPEGADPEETDAAPSATPTGAGVQPVAPVTVDLRSLTPQPGAGELIEQPVPGRPGAAQDSFLAVVVADLSRRTGTAVAEIVIISVTASTWADSGLGCAAPDEAVTAEPVSGYRIVLQAEGEEHRYHTRGKDAFTYCPAAAHDD